MKHDLRRGLGPAFYLPVALLGGALLASWTFFFAGHGMLSVYAWVALLQIVPLLAVVTLVVVVVRTLIATRKAASPIEMHRRKLLTLATAGLSAVALWPLLWNFGVASIRFPYSIESTKPWVTARLPSDAPLRVVWGGDRLEANQHAATPDQRWAYDFIVEPVIEHSSRLEDYPCFGVPVLAPVAGVVRAAHDGEKDRIPKKGPHETNFTAPLGNYVAIELESGGYVLLAHLKEHSVVVRQGERVAEGTPLGTCGNSGNSSEPHIHMHAQRQDPLERPLNFSEGLPLFFHHHNGPPMPHGGVAIENGKMMRTGHIVQHRGSEAKVFPSGTVWN